jgi:hypothetical protein
MTELSPAAQAVLKAACIHHGLFNEEIVQRRRMIAAVLRVLAKQGEVLFDEDDNPVSVVSSDDLLGIAVELEGAR